MRFARLGLETTMSLCGYTRRCAFAAAAVLLLLANSAMADEQAVAESMADFMKGHPDCMEFSDQCSTCAVVDGKAACSTPTIACIKKPYVCTRRAGH
ncbi:hypothetical protein LPU83_2983 [Rhizobium favelukesii]|uniref:Secreted protein n=2 Tax=Rhizobium/Agrobacterium group TaxID=227290 RepID=W6RCP8_9HYPH|nr:hypothetical protein LPU83_2983 [Rhizobium favelukesii]